MSETNVHEYNYPDFSYHVSNTDTNQLALNSVEYNYPDFSMLGGLNSTAVGNTSDNERLKPELKSNDNEEHECDKSFQEDTYNVIGNRSETVAMETYDHRAPMTKNGSNTSDDISYNLSMNTDAQLQGKIGGQTDNVYNIENDTYNKLGGDKPEVVRSLNNLYGSKQIETRGGVLNPALEKDRTYDSTCEKYDHNRSIDNTYSKIKDD